VPAGVAGAPGLRTDKGSAQGIPERVLTIDTFGAPNPHIAATDGRSLRELYRTLETPGAKRLRDLVEVCALGYARDDVGVDSMRGV